MLSFVFQGITTICVPQMPPGNANVIEYIDNSGKKKTTFQQPKTKMGSVLSG
jgi:hypothetical protein